MATATAATAQVNRATVAPVNRLSIDQGVNGGPNEAFNVLATDGVINRANGISRQFNHLTSNGTVRNGSNVKFKANSYTSTNNNHSNNNNNSIKVKNFEQERSMVDNREIKINVIDKSPSCSPVESNNKNNPINNNNDYSQKAKPIQAAKHNFDRAFENRQAISMERLNTMNNGHGVYQKYPVPELPRPAGPLFHVPSSASTPTTTSISATSSLLAITTTSSTIANSTNPIAATAISQPNAGGSLSSGTSNSSLDDSSDEQLMASPIGDNNDMHGVMNSNCLSRSASRVSRFRSAKEFFERLSNSSATKTHHVSTHHKPSSTERSASIFEQQQQQRQQKQQKQQYQNQPRLPGRGIAMRYCQALAGAQAATDSSRLTSVLSAPQLNIVSSALSSASTSLATTIVAPPITAARVPVKQLTAHSRSQSSTCLAATTDVPQSDVVSVAESDKKIEGAKPAEKSEKPTATGAKVSQTQESSPLLPSKPSADAPISEARTDTSQSVTDHTPAATANTIPSASTTTHLPPIQATQRSRLSLAIPNSSSSTTAFIRSNGYTGENVILTIDNSRFNRSNAGKVGNCIGGKQENLLQYNDNSGDNDAPPILLFQGDNVIVGNGSLLTRRNKQLRIQFNESSTLTYEYPSEESLIAMARLAACATQDNGQQQYETTATAKDNGASVSSGESVSGGDEDRDDHNESEEEEDCSSIAVAFNEPSDSESVEQRQRTGNGSSYASAQCGPLASVTPSNHLTRKSKYHCEITV